MKKKVLVAFKPQVMDEIERKVLALNIPELEFIFARSEQEVEKYIADVEIIFAIPFLVSKYINKAEKLKWFQSSFAGVDALIDKDKKSDYLLTNVKDIYSQIMAEYVMGYILKFSKNIIGNYESQKLHSWEQRPYSSISEDTIGIIGTGSIGGYIGKVAANFGMKVYGLSRSGEQLDNFQKVYTWTEQEDFFQKLDYVISVLPSTKETDDIINEKVFSLMKNEAIFMNIGRGSNVVEKDVINALETGTIKAAVLDVFKTEPLPEDSDLWDTKNLYITPHISGYSSDFDQAIDIFKKNYNKFKNNEELLYKIDFKKGY